MKNLSRHLLIDILFSTRGQSEAQTADMIIAALSQQQEVEPDAWMVTGNYTRVAFRSESSAKAYFGGLMQTDPEGGYEIKPLFLHPPKPAAQPQVPEGCPTDIEVREAVAAFMKGTQTFALEDCARLLVKRLKALLSAAKEES